LGSKSHPIQRPVNRIGEMRRAEGLKQAELASRLTEELGRPIDRAAVSDYERGKAVVPDDAKLALAKFLRCPVEWVMAGPNGKTKAPYALGCV
jgi:transcriptional regulator with XRE-family HTH domain